MISSHLFHLSAETPQNKTEGGERIKAYSGNFPILKGMSLYKLLLNPQGVREPHWHPNADELGYCLKGQVLVTFYHTGNLKQTFLVQKGEMFFIPSGAFHFIANVGKEKAELLLQFSHENPEEFGLANSFGAFSNAVLGNTWGVDQKHFNQLPRPIKDQFATLAQMAPIPKETYDSSPYHYNIEASAPNLVRDGGNVHMARHNFWPILKNQSLYSLRLTNKGMREPHWHPETAEMGYVNSGKGRITILNPDGQSDTFLLLPGDVYFIPKAYPHHIENLGSDPLHFLIFFDQGIPQDIGFTSGFRSPSNEILASFLHVDASFFDPLKKYYTSQLIVDRINPIDPK